VFLPFPFRWVLSRFSLLSCKIILSVYNVHEGIQQDYRVSLERLQAEITRHLGRIEREENTELLEKYYLYYPEGTLDLY
jgi:hypothetical protein